MARRHEAIEQEVPPLEPLMGIEDVKQYLGVGRDKIFELIKDRDLPHIRFGGKTLKFQRYELSRWLQNQSSASPQ